MRKTVPLLLLSLTLGLVPPAFAGAAGLPESGQEKDVLVAARSDDKADESGAEKSSEKSSGDGKADSKKKEDGESGSSDKKKSSKKDDKKDEKKSDRKSDKKSDSKSEDKSKGKDDKSTSGKSGGGFFGRKSQDKQDDKKKGKGDETSGKTQAEPAKAAKDEDPNAPKYKTDPALISVLKDVSKSLKDSDAVKSLEDAQDKLVAKLVSDILEKALSSSGITLNRIVAEPDRARMEKTMNAESWESGDLEVSPELKASVVALWAKKVDGLLTVSIVGDYTGGVEGSDAKLGEFVTVITARSTVDKGFDIQSQSDVTYWLAKVETVKIDRGAKASEAQKTSLKLMAPVTARKRAFLVALASYEHDKQLLALKVEEDKKKKEEESKARALSEAQQKAISEALAKSVAEALQKTTAQVGAEQSKSTQGEPPEKKSESPTGDSGTVVGVTGANTASGTAPAPSPQQNMNAQSEPSQNPPSNSLPPVSSTGTAGGERISTLFPEPARTSRSSWESPGAQVASRAPSALASLVYPARALAGSFLTVAVVGGNRNLEPYVEIGFNGISIPTAESGKVVYQVPEDATPGYSLHVGLSARHGEPPSAINVLQPLSLPSSQQAPKVDGVSAIVASKGTITIDGHNFDGVAERNRVIIDSGVEATVLACSPVQIVAEVPHLSSGNHSAIVTTGGLRSNAISFDMVNVQLDPVGDASKGEVKKLVVKVVGTQARVRVKLTNQSRDIIKLVRGDEVVVVTQGGPSNTVSVPVQRLRSGNYKIDTEVLL